MEYSPLPPMIPISACGKRPPDPFGGNHELVIIQNTPRIIGELVTRSAGQLPQYTSFMKRAFASFVISCASVAVAQSALQSATAPVTLEGKSERRFAPRKSGARY
jgi:hypothetical protein